MSTAETIALGMGLVYLLVCFVLGVATGRRQSRYKRKLSYGWTCSDTAHHVHGWYWAAYACGKWQRFKNRKGIR